MAPRPYQKALERVLSDLQIETTGAAGLRQNAGARWSWLTLNGDRHSWPAGRRWGLSDARPNPNGNPWLTLTTQVLGLIGHERASLAATAQFATTIPQAMTLRAGRCRASRLGLPPLLPWRGEELEHLDSALAKPIGHQLNRRAAQEQRGSVRFL